MSPLSKHVSAPDLGVTLESGLTTFTGLRDTPWSSLTNITGPHSNLSAPLTTTTGLNDDIANDSSSTTDSFLAYVYNPYNYEAHLFSYFCTDDRLHVYCHWKHIFSID